MNVQVIDLSKAPGAKESWDKPRIVVYLWFIFEYLFVTNSLQISSKIRISVLRLFGAKIGSNVIFRPRTRVKFPWKLEIGDGTWIGEGVWFHNQDQIKVGSNVVISQETMLTTGSHALRRDMGLITSPIIVESGVWITSRCLVTGGVTIHTSAVITPMSVVRKSIGPGEVWGGNPISKTGYRFIENDK